MWEEEERRQALKVELKACTELISVDPIIVGEFTFLPRIEVSLTIGCDSGRQVAVQNCVIKLTLLEILRGDKIYRVFEDYVGGKYREIRSNE